MQSIFIPLVVMLNSDLFLIFNRTFFKSENVSSSVLVFKSILTSFCEKIFFCSSSKLRISKSITEESSDISMVSRE